MNNYYADIEHTIEMRKKQDSRNYADLINAGVIAQIEKLRDNEHKPGFDNIDIEYATRRVGEEHEELLNEIYKITESGGVINYWHKDNKDFSKIRKEAADIANFAHMLIFKCDQELKKC
jgi:hypothetical protein